MSIPGDSDRLIGPARNSADEKKNSVARRPGESRGYGRPRHRGMIELELDCIEEGNGNDKRLDNWSKHDVVARKSEGSLARRDPATSIRKGDDENSSNAKKKKKRRLVDDTESRASFLSKNYIRILFIYFFIIWYYKVGSFCHEGEKWVILVECVVCCLSEGIFSQKYILGLNICQVWLPEENRMISSL